MDEALYREASLSPLRKIIAARMVEAKQSIPHYRLSMDIEMDALQAARKRQNAESPESPVSINDYMIKALAVALMAYPAINCQFVDGKIREFKQADISVVIAVEGGLSTPVIRSANTLSITEIAQTVKKLSALAKQGLLKMADITGGSFSLSNLGMYNIDQFDAIINPPQCAMLAVGSAKPKVLVKHGEFVEVSIMRVNLSLDHRILDGVAGAEFLNRLREIIELELPAQGLQ